MNSLIRNIYEKRCVEDQEGNRIDIFPTSIEYDVGLSLYDFIRRVKPRQTLEIGMAYGLSTLFICQAHHDNGGGHHAAVDSVQRTQWKSIGLLNTEKACLDGFLKFYDGQSHEVLPKLLEDNERFDFVFIDGSHLFDYMLVDFFYADQLLNPGGYIEFHDIWMPAVQKLISFIMRNRNYSLVSDLTRRPRPAWKRFLISSRFHLAMGLPKYLILKKIGADVRGWKDYKAF